MSLWSVILFISIAVTLAEAKWSHAKRETKSHLCDPAFNNTNKIQCYCNKGYSDDIFKSADCSPTVEGITSNDDNWALFNELKDIKKLSFANSKGVTLKYIPKEVFKHTAEIEKLEIKYGTIETIESFAFGNLSSVNEIILRDNQVKTLKTNAFAHHKSLTTISLDMNMIVEINRDVFIDLPSLEKLYLTSNKITTLHDKAFVHLTHLRELEIDRNNIFSLNSDTFSGLHSLEKLDLSINILEVIGDNTFLELKSILSINLEGNKIQMLDPKAFNGLSSLQSLTLAHNALADIDNEKVFNGLNSLLVLNLKGNKLKALKPEVFAPILKNFYSNSSSLDVEDNNFPCDCRLDWFILLKNHTESPHIKLALENLKCMPDSSIMEKWTQAVEVAEAEKNAQEAEEETQNADFEYYDDTQLKGKLFYIDMRFLLNCTTKIDIATVIPTITTSTTTHKPKIYTEFRSTTNTILTQSYKTSKMNFDPSKDENTVTKSPNDLEKEKKGIYTTSRLATVSAKPLDNKKYDDQDNMASDEAKPEKIKAHRSIQDDVKETPTYNHNGAHKNVSRAFMLLIAIYFRNFCL